MVQGLKWLGQWVTVTWERKITFPAAEERRGGRGEWRRKGRRVRAAAADGAALPKTPDRVKWESLQSNLNSTKWTSDWSAVKTKDKLISRCLAEDMNTLHTAAEEAVTPHVWPAAWGKVCEDFRFRSILFSGSGGKNSVVEFVHHTPGEQIAYRSVYPSANIQVIVSYRGKILKKPWLDASLNVCRMW